jgi:drug/metabolite transporter (DMT)-like permease
MEANSAPVLEDSAWDTDSHRKGFTLATEAVLAKAGAASSKRLPAYLALLGGVVCIAWSAIFVRWTDSPGPASAVYRRLIPAVVLLPTFFFDRRRAPLDARTLGIIAFGGLFFAFDLAFYNTAILQTSAANATLLGNNTPIFVGLLTWLVFRQRPARAFWLGLLMAIAGAVVILWADLAHHTRIGVGDLLALAASACFAVYLMVTEKIRSSTGTLAFLRLAMISSTIALLLINLAMGISLRVPHGHTIWAVLGLGLISQLSGYLFLTYALGHLPATLTSISLLTQGPLTAAMAAVLLGEPLSLAQVLGGLLVLAGVALAHRQRHPEDECNV